MNIIVLAIFTMFISDSNSIKYRFKCGQGKDNGQHVCMTRKSCLNSWGGSYIKYNIQRIFAQYGDCREVKCRMVCDEDKSAGNVCCGLSEFSYPALSPSPTITTTLPPTLPPTIPPTLSPTLPPTPPPRPTRESEDCDGVCVPSSRCEGENLQAVYKEGCADPDDPDNPDPYMCCGEVVNTSNEHEATPDKPRKCHCGSIHDCLLANPYLGICDNSDVLCCEDNEDNEEEIAEQEKTNKVKCLTSDGKNGLCMHQLDCQDTNSTKSVCTGGNICCKLSLVIVKKCGCLPVDKCKVPSPHLGKCRRNSEVPCCVPKKKHKYKRRKNKLGRKMFFNYGTNMKRKCMASGGLIGDCTPHYLCNDWKKQFNSNCNYNEVCCGNPHFAFYGI